jgi:hypothetical protein
VRVRTTDKSLALGKWVSREHVASVHVALPHAQPPALALSAQPSERASLRADKWLLRADFPARVSTASRAAAAVPAHRAWI